MILDALSLLSDAQALAATGVSTNTIDLGNVTPKREVGTGEPLALVVAVDVAADAGTGDETYQFQVIQSANADLSAQDVIVQTDTALITRATLVAGYTLVLPIPPAFPTKRYLGARYVLGGTTPSITVTSFITALSMVQRFRAYASGFTVG